MRILVWALGVFVLLIGVVIVPDWVQKARLERALQSIQPGMTFAAALERLPTGFGGNVSTVADPEHPCMKSAEAAPPSNSDKSYVELCSDAIVLVFSNYENNRYRLSAMGHSGTETFTSRDAAAVGVKRRLGSTRPWSLMGTYTGITPQHRSFYIDFRPDGTVRAVSGVRVWD